MAVVLDAGALIAIERGNRRVSAALRVAIEDQEAVTSSGCVAQAWRDPVRQVRLTRALAGFSERPLDKDAARRCGELLARAHADDIVDAAVALLAEDDDTIFTSDPEDIARLVRAAGTKARIFCV